MTLKYQAIGMRAYDRLVSKHPPKPEQRAEGSSFDMDTFAPALIAACSVDPEISPDRGQEDLGLRGLVAWRRDGAVPERGRAEQPGAGHPFQRERLRKDRNFYLEMSYCFEHGIPHSKFLKWDAEDRAKTLAFALESSMRCSMCGTAPLGVGGEQVRLHRGR